MEELTLAEWLQFEIEKLKFRGLDGDVLQSELRILVSRERHQLLERSIAEARIMVDAWQACAECLEQERSALAGKPVEAFSP